MRGGAGVSSDATWAAALVAVAAAAWTALALGEQGLAPFPVCTRADPAAVSFDRLLAPGALAHEMLMLTAMMAPLTISPLRHLRDRSFARRRARASLLFLVGYCGVWSVAGLIISTFAVGLGVALRDAFAFAALCVVASIWQVSPVKQRMLNRCHNRPALAAFGAAADLDAWRFGVQQGGACVGACWALMATPVVLGAGALPAMVAVSLLLYAERLDRPAPLAWRLRPSAKGLRLLAAQARLRLGELGSNTRPRDISSRVAQVRAIYARQPP